MLIEDPSKVINWMKNKELLRTVWTAVNVMTIKIVLQDRYVWKRLTENCRKHKHDISKGNGFILSFLKNNVVSFELFLLSIIKTNIRDGSSVLVTIGMGHLYKIRFF